MWRSIARGPTWYRNWFWPHPFFVFFLSNLFSRCFEAGYSAYYWLVFRTFSHISSQLQRGIILLKIQIRIKHYVQIQHLENFLNEKIMRKESCINFFWIWGALFYFLGTGGIWRDIQNEFSNQKNLLWRRITWKKILEYNFDIISSVALFFSRAEKQNDVKNELNNPKNIKVYISWK